MSGLDDAYTVLGISQDATPAQVRQAYHRAVRAHVTRPRSLSRR
jgi:curved DNA-binding protein CbpA